MKRLLVFMLFLLLVGCQQAPSEALRACIQRCDVEESQEIFSDYLEALAMENHINIDLDHLTRAGYVFSNANPTMTAINLVYSSEQLSYLDTLDLLDDLHPVYHLLEDDLLAMETEKWKDINVGLAIKEDYNDYILTFSTDEWENYKQLYVEMDGFADDYEIFMSNVLEHLWIIFAYHDEYRIYVKLVTDHGYIHMEAAHGANEIILDINPSSDLGASEVYQNDLAEAIKASLNDQYNVNIEAS